MKKYALLVGVSNYESSLDSFPQGIKNAEAIEEVLLDPELGSFDPNNVMFLANPDRATIERSIKQLFFDRRTDDLLLLYFSGLTIKDKAGQLYFGVRNTRTNRQGNIISSSAVAVKFLRKQMNNCKSSRQVILLDSCLSSSNNNQRNTVNIGQELLSQGLAIWRSKPITTIATASSSNLYCFPSPEEELSPYTSYLVEGIKTGDADFDYDGSISIAELHQYAKQKVQKINPQVKPEIYLHPEDLEIEIIKISLNNAEEKYSEKVLENFQDGEIDPQGRARLDGIRKRLRLPSIKAQAIEDEIIKEYQQELQQKLERFKQDFSEAIEQEIAPSEADIQRLKENFQTILGLTDEQTREIEDEVKSEIETHSKHLETYEQKLFAAMRKENPISANTRNLLERMQKRWKLSDRDVALAASRVNFKLKSYQEKLSEYERELLIAVRQQYPISHTKRSALIKKQQTLGLLEEDIAEIQSRLRENVQNYRQGLAEYKKNLALEIDRNYPLTQETRAKLKEIQQQFQLKDEDIIKVESQIIREKRLDVALVKPKLNTDGLMTINPSSSKIVPSNRANPLKALNKPNIPSLADLQHKINLPTKVNLPNLPTKVNLPNLPDLPNPDLLLNRIYLNRRSYLKWIFFIIIGGILSVLAKLFLNSFSSIVGSISSFLGTIFSNSPDREGPNNPSNSTIKNPDRTPDKANESPLDKLGDIFNNNNDSKLPLQQQSFQVVSLNDRAQQINSSTETAEYLTEDLGNGIPLEMVYVPEGNFIMGTPPTEKHSTNSERPQHRVSIKPFLMGKYQVTQAQWRQISQLPKVKTDLNPNSSHFKGDRRPVETISWIDAVEFCQRLSRKTGDIYRLPSEAEWEYAARANTTTPFYFGPTISSDVANYRGRFIYTNQPRGISRDRTTEVGSFPPNAFGLYDMHGNVLEWCQDTWHNNYSGAPTDGSAWISQNRTSRLMRGGAWSSDAISCRSGFRGSHPASGRYRTLGFRIVREI